MFLNRCFVNRCFVNRGRMMKLWVERYGETKYFGLYDADQDGELLAAFAYKRGAKNLKRILEEMDAKIRFLEEQVLRVKN
jgi:hypothetical protein